VTYLPVTSNYRNKDTLSKNALLVAKTGPLQEGLHALLAAQSNIDSVTVTSGYAAALSYVSDRCPALILLVIESLDDRQKEILAALRNNCAETRILGVVDSEEMHQVALNSNIDVVFSRGGDVRELSKSIESILNH
jgi:DNA-binding NarL/FixJ family response regulator